MKTLNTFILQAQKIHKDKYDYSKVVYNGSKIKILIKCNACQNEFWQLPSSHLQGVGCPFCAKKKCGQYRKSNKIEFITKAKKIHKNKYDYSKVNYINDKTKVEIICKKCNRTFWQVVRIHLKGCGCPYCKKLVQSNRQTLTQIQFIEKAKKMHGNNYDYTKSIYINNATKLKIFCNTCKQYFFQRADSHLKGCGCPRCRKSKGEQQIKKLLDLYSIKHIPQFIFKDCKDKRPLPFDFYLPDFNICIEYQGEQHYKKGFAYFIKIYKDVIQANKKYILLKKHDYIKKYYCKKHNIKLIEIKYNESLNKLKKELNIL